MVADLAIKCTDCGKSNLTKSGSNSFRTLRKAADGKPAVRVRVQRYLCKDCGKFNFTTLDGRPIEEAKLAIEKNGGKPRATATRKRQTRTRN